jgi:hypothetical protein
VRVLAGLLLGLWLCVQTIPSDAGPIAVNATLGASVECNPALATCLDFPTSFSFLCNGTGGILDCPQFFAPDWADTTGLRFFGITNRTNPPRCVQSTDGGSTFGLCPSNPFSAAVDIFGAFFTVSSDGSLLAAAQDAPDNCIIRRSTNYGTSWATVYTDATAGVSCGIGFGSPTTNNIHCASTGGYCVLVGRDGVFDVWAIYSTDNGLNWTKGVAFTLVNGNGQVSVKTDGTRGSLTRLGVNYAGSQPLGEQIVSDWDNTTATPAPGTGDTAANGAAAVVFNGVETVIAGPGGVTLTTHYRYTIAGGAPILVNSFVPAGAPAFANGPVFMVHGFSNIGYFITRNLAGTNVNVYLSVDGFDTVALISSVAPATALIAGCCTGDVHTFGGRIYFTGGGTASTAWLARIQ